MRILTLLGIPMLFFTFEGNGPPVSLSFQYHLEHLRGWEVHVESGLYRNKEMWGKVGSLLDAKLAEIERRLPVPVVERLRKVHIWMHLNREGCPGGVYHPSRDWLVNHDLNPQWARGVEFGNAQNFLDWEWTQPSMVIHEMSHAWHHQVLGYDHAETKDLYRKVASQNKLESVIYCRGGKQRAYGLNNHQEMFAEFSEAWWGTNDFYPFVRGELLAEFPDVAILMGKAWKFPK
jgi:dipeptidyl-peptidase-4